MESKKGCDGEQRDKTEQRTEKHWRTDKKRQRRRKENGI